MRPYRFAYRLTILMLCAIATGIALHGNHRIARGLPWPTNRPEDSTAASALTLQLENYATNLERPVGVANAGDMRLFVLEQAGRIRILDQDGSVRSQPFLDIRARVDDSGTEEGLLGLAFHPKFHENGLFYVNYTNSTVGVLRTRISRFSVSADPNIADPSSENILLTVDQPYPNHNAGKIIFGPDGYLYIPLGDGGGGGDLDDNAQNGAVLLGKISRIDVDNGSGTSPDCQGVGSTGDYSIPLDNPLVDGPGETCDEIWATGLRNPWQTSFDSLTGDLLIADVGQNKVEEVDFQPALSSGGENYGWRCYEGSSEYNVSGCSDSSAYTFPIFEYEHSSPDGGCSITGGYVYRGQRYRGLYGRYFLTDYCSGVFWDLEQQSDGSWLPTPHNDVFPPGETSKFGNSAFGQRCDGELFVANRDLGKLFHLTDHASLDQDPISVGVGRLLDVTPRAYLPLVATSSCR